MLPLNCRIIASSIASVFVFGPSISASAETVFLQPGADTTLIEIAPDSNMGGADFFNAGTAGNGNRNRALLWFDVSAQVPAGALIESVTLTLDMVREPASGWEAALFGLHRVNVSWGEGDKTPEDGSPGLGSSATAGEATWLYRHVGGPSWAAPGGGPGVDFVLPASSTALVFGLGDTVEFEGTASLVADVQSWVNNPGGNFGWVLMTESEDVRKSARGFASRENESGGPILSIQYTVVPEPEAAIVLVGGLMAWAWVASRRRR